MQIFTAIPRTVIPSLWGSLITWLVLLVPALEPLQAYLLSQSDQITAVVTAAVTSVVIGAWYAVWRWLQPRLPDWLIRAVLGSAKTPVYAPVTVANPASSTAAEAARTATQSLDRVEGPDHRATN